MITCLWSGGLFYLWCISYLLQKTDTQVSAVIRSQPLDPGLVLKIGDWHGLCVNVSLDQVTAAFLQFLNLIGLIDALGHNAHSQVMGQLDELAYHHPGFFIFIQQELPVQLDGGYIQILQHGQ